VTHLLSYAINLGRIADKTLCLAIGFQNPLWFPPLVAKGSV